MTNKLNVLVAEAVKRIQSMPPSTRFRVISHYDADGITAAAILCMALYREGYDFHVSLMRNPFTQGLERVKKENNDIIIFLDMGSGQIPIISQMKSDIIIIDHHQPLTEKPPVHILQINANLCGINGNYEACGASLSYAVARTMDKENKDLAAFALAGVTGDKQYIGGIRGFNKIILDEAIENKIVTQQIGIKLSGASIADALYYAVDPYYPGISGNKAAVHTLLDKLHIDPSQQLSELSDEAKQKLQSYLIFTLVRSGCEQNIIDTVIRLRYYADATHGELEQFADLLDSCGKGGHRDLGLSICFKDKKAYDTAVSLERTYKQMLLDELHRIEENGVFEKHFFRFFYSNHSSLGGVIGGIATNFLLDKHKPLFSLVRQKDELHVSCRGNSYLVHQGLDLGAAMKEIAALLDGYGGGHKIAAGATLPLSQEEAFLKQVDSILSKQLKGSVNR